ncbi:MAG: hypothetical protein WBG38_10975 [Nodosilinea sp.]
MEDVPSRGWETRPLFCWVEAIAIQSVPAADFETVKRRKTPDTKGLSVSQEDLAKDSLTAAP